MHPTNAALLAVVTLFGLFMLAQGEGARASAISLRAARHGSVAATTPCAAPHAKAER